MEIRQVSLAALLMMTADAFAQDRANVEYPLHALDEVAALVEQHPGGIKVTVNFPIARIAFIRKGPGTGHVFLDSMADYRDPRSINVNVFPHAARRLNLTPEAKLEGKSLTVQGFARRVRIRCHNGCPQDAAAEHYFQTQIFVREGDDAQVEVGKDE